jgi:hypothetical protein
LLFSRNHVRDRAKEAVGRRRHRGRRNGRKKPASVDGPLAADAQILLYAIMYLRGRRELT